MRHKSVIMAEPCEFINIVPMNPLISKCQIKVCYVGPDPNRNHSVITKEVATEMANSLPGSPIVGYYNESNQDFEEHNRIIDISNGKFEIKDTTRPYGFVDLGAKCWFQKFEDDDQIVREYLMTEGWLWTGQYPECRRIIEKGNNQSMELDEKTLDATWSKDNNGNYKFFIINEAIISKLCILGDDSEPCFEGATITNVQFSFDEGFKNQLFSMMTELKKLMKEGGSPVFSNYAIEIGDSLWESIYSYLRNNYPANESYSSIYSLEGVYVDENSTKFALLKNKENSKYYRMNFNISESAEFIANSENNFVEITETDIPASQFSAEDVEKYETEFKKKEEEKKVEEDSKEDNSSEEDDKAEEDSEDSDKDTEDSEEEKDEEDKKKKKYSLDEIPEYIELNNSYSMLQEENNSLKSLNESLNAEIKALKEFKLSIERKEKENMINGFYMLSDEDKADVRQNIDTYSLDEIEAKLAVACYRNKVSFEDNSEAAEPEQKAATVFNLNSSEIDNEAVPAWIKVAMDVAKSMN